MTREAKQGELRGIRIVEKLEKMFKRPETKLDAQKILSRISSDAQTYARHLVISGPSSNVSAAKELRFTGEQLEAAATELEIALFGEVKSDS